MGKIQRGSYREKIKLVELLGKNYTKRIINRESHGKNYKDKQGISRWGLKKRKYGDKYKESPTKVWNLRKNKPRGKVRRENEKKEETKRRRQKWRKKKKVIWMK